MLFGPARIHAYEHLCPVLGFRAAGTGVEGQDGVARIVFTGKEQQYFAPFDFLQEGIVLFFNFTGQIRFLFFHGNFQVVQEVCCFRCQFFVAFDFRLQECRFLRNFTGLVRVIPKIRIAHLHVQIHNAVFLFSEVKVNPRFPVFSSLNLPKAYAFLPITQESPSFK